MLLLDVDRVLTAGERDAACPRPTPLASGAATAAGELAAPAAAAATGHVVQRPVTAAP